MYRPVKATKKRFSFPNLELLSDDERYPMVYFASLNVKDLKNN